VEYAVHGGTIKEGDLGLPVAPEPIMPARSASEISEYCSYVDDCAEEMLEV
jgi:hypothetical protein